MSANTYGKHKDKRMKAFANLAKLRIASGRKSVFSRAEVGGDVIRVKPEVGPVRALSMPEHFMKMLLMRTWSCWAILGVMPMLQHLTAGPIRKSFGSLSTLLLAQISCHLQAGLPLEMLVFRR